MQSLSVLHELFLHRQMPSVIHAAWQVAVPTAAGLSAQLSCLHSHVKCCGGKRFVHAPQLSTTDQLLCAQQQMLPAGTTATLKALYVLYPADTFMYAVKA